MSRPRLLDLFCGAGGAAVGYARAGFEVVGVDHVAQPNYPFRFVQDDALALMTTYPWWDEPPFDAIHASPPCQAYTVAQRIRGSTHPDLIAPTRELLEDTGLPYVIENVPGAPLRDAVRICGSGLGMGFCRHRLFELNWDIGTLIPPCARGQLVRQPEHVLHTRKAASVRGQRIVAGIQIFGDNARADAARAAMGIDWMNRDELSQAIPPAYTELIGYQLMSHIRVAA